MSGSINFGYSSKNLADFYSKVLNFTLKAGDNEVTILGLRGVKSITPGFLEIVPNEPDLYNDILIALTHTQAGWEFRQAQATIEPGRYYTEIDPYPQGAAHVPLYRVNSFVRGTHRGEPCLTASGGITVVWRDENGNYRLDPYEKLSKARGIQIHRGGSGRSIGKYSAGCLVIKRPDWQAFLDFCRRNTRDDFPVVLIEGTDLYRFVVWYQEDMGAPSPFYVTVSLGSKGYHVEVLQRLLILRYKQNLVEDGIFGSATLAAFLNAQRSIGLLESELSTECHVGMWERLTGQLGPYLDEMWPRLKHGGISWR